jgi:hypothetical protein
VTQDGTTLRSYVDGVADVTDTYTSGTFNLLNRAAVGALVRSTVGSYFSGGVFFGAAWNRVLSADEVAELSRNPWQLFRPQVRRIYFPGAAGQTIAVGQASETDSALALTVNPLRRLVNQASETDTAQTVTLQQAQTIPVGLVSETDTAQAITVNPQHRLIGQATETDEALAITVVGGAAPVAEARQQGAGKSRRKYKRRYVVTIDGQEFQVSSREEAEALLAEARQAVEEAIAPATVDIASTPQFPIALPQIRVSGDVGPDLTELVSLVSEARQQIKARFQDAARALEIAYLMRREQDRTTKRP